MLNNVQYFEFLIHSGIKNHDAILVGIGFKHSAIVAVAYTQRGPRDGLSVELIILKVVTVP